MAQPNQHYFTPRQTATLAITATAVFVSATSVRRGPNLVVRPSTVIIDAIYGSGTGTATVVTFSVSGTVRARMGLPANGMRQYNPVHIVLPEGGDLEVVATSTCAVHVDFHRDPDV